MFKIILFIFISLFISSCGSSNNSNLTNKKTAYFIDSAISGVEYTCDDIKGITAFNGEFTYNNSCEIVFTVGGILLGQINSTDINVDKNVLPADLFGLKRENTQDQRLVRLIQFLQTIDNDNNPYNSIEITQDLRDKLKYHFLDFSNASINDNDILALIQVINKKLVSKEKALKHYKKTLRSKFDLTLDINDEINDIFEEKTEVKNSLLEEVLSKKMQKIPAKTEEEKEVLSVDIQEFIQEKVVQKQQPLPKDITQEERVQEQEIIQEEERDEIIKPSIRDVIVNLESNNIKEQEEKGFSYNNQRDVRINITTKELLYNKEIVIYEKNTVYKTPVGNTEKLENRIVATVFDEKGELNLTYTLGNHIQSVWIVIPYYRLRLEVSISNNNINLNIEN